MGFVMFNQATVSRMPPQSVNSARGSYSRLLRSRRRIEEEMGRLDPLLASPKQHGSSRSKQRCSASGKELACRFRRRKKRGFDPWGWKSPWRKKMQPTPVFWSGESHGLCSLQGHKESDTTERLSLSLFILVTVLETRALRELLRKSLIFKEALLIIVQACT